MENYFWFELLGTMILILLGDGVVANMLLSGTKGNSNAAGNGAAWAVISLAWGFAVFVAVIVASPSGAHINPAVTIGLAVVNKFPWALVPVYIVAQVVGAALGASLVWLFYKKHFDITDGASSKLACFATIPAIRNYKSNFFSETVGTFVLLIAVFYIAEPNVSGAGIEGVTLQLGSVSALPVALVVVAIGMSLGGTTGYAINPARDLGPRIMHTLLPIKGKGSSDWKYSWVPVAGPVAGAGVAALVFWALGM